MSNTLLWHCNMHCQIMTNDEQKKLVIKKWSSTNLLATLTHTLVTHTHKVTSNCVQAKVLSSSNQYICLLKGGQDGYRKLHRTQKVTRNMSAANIQVRLSGTRGRGCVKVKMRKRRLVSKNGNTVLVTRHSIMYQELQRTTNYSRASCNRVSCRNILKEDRHNPSQTKQLEK